MAEALATILLDGPMRSEMAEVMRRRVASYYHKDRVTRIYEELYAEMMAQPAPLIDLEHHDRSIVTIEAMTRRGTLSGVLGAIL